MQTAFVRIVALKLKMKMKIDIFRWHWLNLQATLSSKKTS
jgi:hypothetical protein